jgi:hypothetical protein
MIESPQNEKLKVRAARARIASARGLFVTEGEDLVGPGSGRGAELRFPPCRRAGAASAARRSSGALAGA